MSQSKHALKGDIITIRRGVAIYQTNASPFWMARVLDPNTKKYVVRSTKETARLKAREVAEELAADLAGAVKTVPKEYAFTYYAQRFIEKGNRLVASGERNANYIKTATYFLNQDKLGLVKHFGPMDVRELRTRHWAEFLDKLGKTRPDLSPSTRNIGLPPEKWSSLK